MADFINTIDLLGDEVVAGMIVDRSITEFNDDILTSIGFYSFDNCRSLTSIAMPNVTLVADRVFGNCVKLTSASFPKATSVGEYCFSNCGELSSLFLPNVTTLKTAALGAGQKLIFVDLPKVTSIASLCFKGNYRMKGLILRSETMCTLASTNVFQSCYHFLGTVNGSFNPNGDKDGYIYVPSALVSSYETATNWSTFAGQFRALENYTVDGTITGELDESKI